jgi:proline dehydrogenase
MTRAFFLWLSQNALMRKTLESSGPARKLTKRFVAGETLADEVATLQELAAEGIYSTGDHLGENVTTLAEAEAARDAYLDLLDEIERRSLPSSISLKLTAIGLDLSEEAAVSHLRTLAERAHRIGSRVEIDMEDTRYTNRTIAIAERVSAEFECVRVCIQAYLKRTPEDIDRLNRSRVMVRLCKGAYIEPAALAYPKKSDVDVAYLELVKKLLDAGTYPALATHDERMINAILMHVRKEGVRADSFEFQMLHGIRRDLQQKLTKQGFRVRVYVPYGAAWYRYFMRRLAERPANVWFLASNFFR